MNILINGSGAVGLGLGASMLSQKADVSFYATGKTAAAKPQSGGKTEKPQLNKGRKGWRGR